MKKLLALLFFVLALLASCNLDYKCYRYTALGDDGRERYVEFRDIDGVFVDNPYAIGDTIYFFPSSGIIVDEDMYLETTKVVREGVITSTLN